MEDIERKNIMAALKVARQQMYDDLIAWGWIDGSTPVEHYAPEHLWKISRERILELLAQE